VLCGYRDTQQRRKVMAVARLSRLQKRILRWLRHDYQRTQGRTSSSHHELACALRSDKGNISHSLHALGARGLIVIGRSPGGKAEYVLLTGAGHQQAAQLEGGNRPTGQTKLTSNVTVE
jgi:DNA-binding MarR family transcriptional regulator